MVKSGKEILQERFEILEKNIAELRLFRQNNTVEDVKRQKRLEWALRYGLLESIQIVIDISCHVASDYNLGTPVTYSECIELLEKNNYLPADISERLYGMVGLRNLLIHEYHHIDVDRLYSLLNYIKDFENFITYLSNFL